MTSAPSIADRVIVSAHSEPAFTAPVVAVLGYDSHHGAFSVEVVLLMDVPKYDPFNSRDPYSCSVSRVVKATALVRQRDDRQWEVINPKAPTAALR